jgi:hypothetical protein
MRKLAMFLAAAFATVVLQTTLGPATAASAGPGSETASTSTSTSASAVEVGRTVAAGTWLHWDNYFSEDRCEFMGAMGMLADAWQEFYCVYDWSLKPWALHVYFA